MKGDPSRSPQLTGPSVKRAEEVEIVGCGAALRVVTLIMDRPHGLL